VVAWRTEELVALGHDVALFASGDSKTRASLVPIIPVSASHALIPSGHTRRCSTS